MFDEKGRLYNVQVHNAAAHGQAMALVRLLAITATHSRVVYSFDRKQVMLLSLQEVAQVVECNNVANLNGYVEMPELVKDKYYSLRHPEGGRRQKVIVRYCDVDIDCNFQFEELHTSQLYTVTYSEERGWCLTYPDIQGVILRKSRKPPGLKTR